MGAIVVVLVGVAVSKQQQYWWQWLWWIALRTEWSSLGLGLESCSPLTFWS